MPTRLTGGEINDDNERGRDDDEPSAGRRSRFVASGYPRSMGEVAERLGEVQLRVVGHFWDS
jgi:hypothetical protein